MYHVTWDYAKTHLEELLERVKSEREGIVIVKENQRFILMDQDELESIRETSEWLKDAGILDDIQQARQECERGEVVTMEQVFGHND